MAEGNGQREPATPQEIWEILREVSAVQQETARHMQETDRHMQETDRRMQETDQLIERQARAAERRMDKLDELFNGQWGKLIESLVEGDLTGLLQQRGIAVQHMVTNPRQGRRTPTRKSGWAKSGAGRRAPSSAGDGFGALARTCRGRLRGRAHRQPAATSNAVTLRVSRLNSTPIRWIGLPPPRYLAA